MNPKPSSARRDTTVLIVATSVSGLAAYAFIAIGTRAVGAAAFAPVSVLWTFWAASAAAITFPVQHWIIRTTEADGSEHAVWRAFPRICAMAAVGGVLLLGVGLPFGPRLLQSEEPVFAVMTGLLPLGSVVVAIARGILAARRQFTATAAAILSENAVRTIVAVVVYDRFGAGGLGWALMGGFLIVLFFPGSFRERPAGPGRSTTRLTTLAGVAGANVAAQLALTIWPVVLGVLGAAPARVTAFFALLAVLRAPYTVALGVSPRLTGPLTLWAAEPPTTPAKTLWRLVPLGGAAVLAIPLGTFLLTPTTRLLFGVTNPFSMLATTLLVTGAVLALCNLVLNLTLLAQDDTGPLVRIWMFALAVALVMLLAPVDSALRVSIAFVTVETLVLLAAGRRALANLRSAHAQPRAGPETSSAR